MVFGVHGAALANALFCRDGAALVELTMRRRAYAFPTGFRDYAHLAAAMGLEYWPLPTDLEYARRVQLPVRRVLAVVAQALWARLAVGRRLDDGGGGNSRDRRAEGRGGAPAGEGEGGPPAVWGSYIEWVEEALSLAGRDRD